MSKNKPDDLHPDIRAALDLDGDPNSIKAYYEDWAARYDQTVANEDYAGPEVTVRMLTELAGEQLDGLDLANKTLAIADVGCGTGLVGALLYKAGYRSIDGMDLSPAMVALAQNLGIYRHLYGDVDITRPVPDPWLGAYDVVLSCGMFTLGHVPPETLSRLAKMTRPGGWLIVSTRTAYYDGSYQQVSDRYQAAGLLRLHRVLRNAPYTDDSKSHYWIYQVRSN